MSESTHSDEHEVFGHEPDVVRVSGVIRVAIGLSLIVVVSMVGMVALFRGLDNPLETDLPEWATPPSTAGPPTPQIDPYQSQQLRALRKAHEETLTSYEWVNEQAGVARIPIDRAMEMLVEEQPPARSPSRD